MFAAVRWLVIAVVVLVGIAPAHADPVELPDPAPRLADQIERARQVSLSPDLQPELPGYGTGEGSAQGAKMQRPRRAPHGQRHPRDRRMIDTRERASLEGGSPLVSMFMWGLVIVFAVLGVSWIASELSKYGGDAELPASESQVRMQAAVDAIIDRPLGDADELARHGEFAEAIHTLLLRTLQELVRSAAVRVGPAMTSREILARVPLLADARMALADLITAVELTHFGDEPANATDYERCRQQFHVFAAALRSGLAARPQAAEPAQGVAA